MKLIQFGTYVITFEEDDVIIKEEVKKIEESIKIIEDKININLWRFVIWSEINKS